jgi:hypothetical protein
LGIAPPPERPYGCFRMGVGYSGFGGLHQHRL